MHFRFFDDLVGWAPGTSPELQFGEENFQQKITQQRLLRNVWKIYIKFAKNFTKFQKCFIKILKHKKIFRKFY